MAKTLLAVDDSVTMRKVLEITFSGEDFRVVTAESSQTALGKLAENPQVFVIDTSLGNEDGYALAKEVRKRSPQASIILLASRYAPYDQARGRDAGVDDYADKPFDTQALIDKVRKVVVAKEAGEVAAPPPMRAVATAPSFAPSPTQNPMPGAAAPRPAGPPPVGRGTQPSLGGAVPARPGTLMFGESPNPPVARPAAPAPVAAPAPAPAAAPAAAAAAPAAAAAAAVSTAVGGAVNGSLANKLGGLGLTPQQADAVLALSREVVERVVWEVVPQLAETLIKEEIARLTRD